MRAHIWHHARYGRGRQQKLVPRISIQSGFYFFNHPFHSFMYRYSQKKMPLLILLRVVCTLNAKSVLTFFWFNSESIELVSSKMKSGIKNKITLYLRFSICNWSFGSRNDWFLYFILFLFIQLFIVFALKKKQEKRTKMPKRIFLWNITFGKLMDGTIMKSLIKQGHNIICFIR